MKTNFVFVDYENVQPRDLGLFKDGPFKVKIFLGPNQSKLNVALVTAMQPLGNNAEYVSLETAGNNALDFHIAYYVGLHSSADPSAHFHIISKDKGFDSLIKHLKKRNISVNRSASISEMSYFKPALKAATITRVEAVVADLVRRKAAKPRTQKTLLSTISALFRKELSEFELSHLFDALCKRGIVTVDGTKVSYSLPDDS